MKNVDMQHIWENYLNREDKSLAAGIAGKPWGDETPILEGVNCDCQTCAYWVVGDKCKAESISIMKNPENGLPACATYETSNPREI